MRRWGPAGAVEILSLASATPSEKRSLEIFMSFDQGAQIATILIALVTLMFGGWAYVSAQIRKIEARLESHKLYSANTFVSLRSAEKTEIRLISAIKELTSEVKSLRDSFLSLSYVSGKNLEPTVTSHKRGGS